MKHASTQVLDTLAPLLERLRAIPGLRERKPGTFYLRSGAFLHFHEDPAGLFADVKLDGALVEKMSPTGLELMVGAKRDPGWGTVLLLGLGGIWVEALGDVQLLPGDAGEEQILEALRKLRSAKLLDGVRGAPPSDVEAVAQTVMAIGRLMRTIPELIEIDINPLMVHAKGQGATALDALIVAE